jgi:hypothetical protein
MTDNDFIVERSMRADDLLEKFYKLRKKHRNAPALFHARLATHGTKNLSNCHPFYVAGSKKTLLAHNGILPVNIEQGDPRSDTKVFAEDYMKHLGIKQLDDPIGYDIITEYCRGSKLVILNQDNRLTYQWYIINESSGTWEDSDKCWYSNLGYRSAARYTYTKYASAYNIDKPLAILGSDVATELDEETFEWEQPDYCECWNANLTDLSEQMPYKQLCDMACKTCPIWDDTESETREELIK